MTSAAPPAKPTSQLTPAQRKSDSDLPSKVNEKNKPDVDDNKTTSVARSKSAAARPSENILRKPEDDGGRKPGSDLSKRQTMPAKMPPVDPKTRERLLRLQRDLNQAIEDRRPSKVKKLLRSRVALDAPSTSPAKLRPFHEAVRRTGTAEDGMLKAFVSAEPRLVSAADQESGQTSLLVAVASGRLSNAQWLVDEAKARIDVRNTKTGSGVWHETRAMSPADPPGVGRVGGQTMAAGMVVLFRKHRSDYRTTPIHEAAAGGDLPLIDYLVGIGHDLWATDDDGYNFMHVAVFNNRSEFVRHFVERRRERSESTSNTVIERKNPHNGKTPLHVAANRGYIECVRILLTFSASPSIRDDAGWTALHDAAAGRSADQSDDVVGILLDAGAGGSREPAVRVRSAEGETPLHVAARHGRLAAVRRLVIADPGTLTVVDRDGWTPLHAAIGAATTAARPELVAALLSAAADAMGRDETAKLTEIRDKKGRSPKQLAASNEENKDKLLKELNIFGASVSATGDRV